MKNIKTRKFILSSFFFKLGMLVGFSYKELFYEVMENKLCKILEKEKCIDFIICFDIVYC